MLWCSVARQLTLSNGTAFGVAFCLRRTIDRESNSDKDAVIGMDGSI